MMDFIVIGAGRSGTTTLFNHLKQNPAIFIPPQKEIPIGVWPVDKYMETYFSKAGERAKGTITPQYMAHDSDYKYAELLHGYWPGAKIIALLRHPYERARSHHQQRTRRGHEHESLEACFVPGRRYWDRSLYGERLKTYFDLYGNVLVVYTDELKNDPAALLKKISEYIGVEYYEPKGLGEYYNVGRAKPSVFQLIQKALKKLPIKRLAPKWLRQRIWFWLEMARSRGKATTEESRGLGVIFGKHPARHIRLAFTKDAALIWKLTGEHAPWIRR